MFKEKPKYICYQDESGIDGGNRYFIIGILFINKDKENDFREIIYNIRSEYSFKNEIHFVKMSKLRYEVYKGLLENVINYGNYIFDIIVIDKRKIDMRYFGGKCKMGKARVYNKFTNLRLYNSMKRIGEGDYYVYTDYKTRMKEDNFIEYLKGNINFKSFYDGYDFCVKTVEPISSNTDDLLQLNDLFLGCLGNIYNKKNSLSERKKNLTKLVYEDTQINSNRYNLWKWKPRIK
ncbi:DUF3800 domain-containing protein [Anaerosalibacter bizertensis]|uniref:DUF3800 domain-containing protein n=1 Tax=Anaerosalibacter bizertensis TaxID=932217 RepID=UPI001C0EE0A6|nr:DUF3800 domain-containing protein [Anaerosalibacter bizertensis]MBU5293135.1 DUF3800 domain-containing protein [Anaerosalibacter bizertensis]